MDLQQAYTVRQKQARTAQVDAIRNRVLEALITPENAGQKNHVNDLFSALGAKIVRGQILNGERALTVVTPAPCVPLPFAPACCRALPSPELSMLSASA